MKRNIYCGVCGELKVDAGKRLTCKKCNNARASKWAKENRNKVNDKNNKWRKNNKDISQKSNNYMD